MSELEQAIADFLAAQHTPNTLRNYRYILKGYRKFVGDTWPITQQAISEYLASLKDRGLKHHSVKCHDYTLRALCDWLISQGRMDAPQVEPKPILGEPITSTQQAVRDFLNAKKTLSRNTTRSYALALGKYAKFVTWPPTAENITDFLLNCQDQGLSISTVRTHFTVIKTFCNWLEARHKIANNPIRFVAAPKSHRKIPRAPKVEVLRKFFEAIDFHCRYTWVGIRDRAAFMLLADTGMRIGELCLLKIGDYDLSALEIYIPEEGKTGTRLVVMSPQAKGFLVDWLVIRDGRLMPPNFDWLFLSSMYGEHLTPAGMRQRKNYYCRQANIPNFRIHDLRHNFALRALQNGAPLTDVSAQLGHADIATTAIYTYSLALDRHARHKDYSPIINLIT